MVTRYNVDMSRKLADKVILITGGSSGIGAATAEACAQAGMHVSLAARRGDRLAQVAKTISSHGVKAHYFTCNIAADRDLRAWIDEAWVTFGRVDAIFANAGYGMMETALSTPDDEHHAMFETNYFACLRTLRHALPRVKATPNGLRHLLLCSSTASEFGIPMMGPYAASKAAQHRLATAMRAELKPDNIKVTSVHPVGTKTEFFDVAKSEGSSSNTPDAFSQTAEQVAQAVVRSLKRPKPEVWPMWPARFAVALGVAFPSFSSWIADRTYKQMKA